MVHPLSGKTVKLVNEGSRTALDLQKGSSTDKTKISGWGDNGGKNQQWKLEKVDSDYGWDIFLIVNVQSGTALDLFEGKSENGTTISGRTIGSRTNSHQNWYVLSGDADFKVITIINVGTGTSVDLKDGGSYDNTAVTGYAGHISSGTSHQLWKVTIIS